MWVTVARFRVEGGRGDSLLAKTAHEIGSMASDLPGYRGTKLYGSKDRGDLLCVSAFATLPSAQSFADALRSEPDKLAASYGARLEDFVLAEEIAAYEDGLAEED